MPNNVVSVEKISKTYRLGVIGTGTFVGDVQRWWSRNLGKPDPYAKIGEIDYRGYIGETICALDNVSFNVPQGQALGVIGRNGAGKSTLLKILSQVTAPSSGVVKVRGRIASLLEVGTGFHPELTGRENVYLNGMILGMNRAEITQKFDEILGFSGVEKFIDTPVKRYSSGMKVRLAFSVAAHLDPEILVVDEVLAVGDAEFQKKCLGKMDDVTGEGRTVLFVSHNMSAINRLCSRVILLDKGKLVSDGNAEEITAQYLMGANETSGIRAWDAEDAPGTDKIKLTSVRVLKNHNTPVSTVDVRDEVSIRLDYYVGKPKLSFRCSVIFYTLGTLAFAAVEPIETVRSKPGNYYSILKVPAHLFGENEYFIGVTISASTGAKERYVSVKEVLSFQVVDSMEDKLSARGDYAQNFAGVLRPRLEWEISDIQL